MAKDHDQNKEISAQGEASQPQEHDEMTECLLKLKKLFIAIDAIVKSIIITPDPDKGKADQMELSVQPGEEEDDDMLKLAESVREYEEYIQSLRDAEAQQLAEEEDDFNQPD